MATIINIHEAKTHLSKIIDEVAAGREVIIAKAGKPMARLAPLTEIMRPKKLGLLKGKLEVPDDFNKPLDDSELATFEQMTCGFSSIRTCSCGRCPRPGSSRRGRDS
jgi:prevent-host-death family protein